VVTEVVNQIDGMMKQIRPNQNLERAHAEDSPGIGQGLC
jgi:hypothetical protein